VSPSFAQVTEMALLHANILFALAYRFIPELRQVVFEWEMRALAATTGLVFAYIILRLNCGTNSGPEVSRVRRTMRQGLGLALGLMPTWFLWSLVDPIANEYTLAEIWETSICEHLFQEMVLCTLGWLAWSLVIGELLIVSFHAVTHLRKEQSTLP
jgi:hypothetical protein